MPHTKDFRVSLKDAQGDDAQNVAHFEGYAATFDREPDSYGDVIAKGAFADTLKAHSDDGRKIPLLFGHVMDDPDYSIGTVDASEDERGLKVDGTIYLDTPKGETVYKMLKRGQVDRMSFAYDVLEDSNVTLEDGEKAHQLDRLDLFECSIVTVPANQHAQITNVKEQDMQEKIGRRNSKADEDTIKTIKDAVAGVVDDLGKVMDALDKLTGESDQDDGDTGGDAGSDGGADAQGAPSEGEDPAKAALDAYKKALISDYTKE